MQIRTDHLTPNKFSRPQRPLVGVRAIVMHWVANPATSASANRDYWERRKAGGRGYGSAHYVVDDHEIVEAIPPDEMAYHVGSASYTRFAVECISPYPNNATIGVEMCHPDWTGEYSDRVWQQAVGLVGTLLLANALRPHHITTHHAITGKECPRWFIEHPADLERFRWDVASYMEGGS